MKLGEVTAFDLNHRSKQVEVDVDLGVNRNFSGIQFQTPIGGMWVVPNVGDIVEIYDAPSGKAARYPVTPTAFSMPSDLGEGDVSIKFNEDTELRFRKNTDGTFDIQISCDGKLQLGDRNGSYKPVARQGDPVSVSTDTGNGQIDDGSDNVDAS